MRCCRHHRDRARVAFLIGGLVVTEQVFNLNGIGKSCSCRRLRAATIRCCRRWCCCVGGIRAGEFRDRHALRGFRPSDSGIAEAMSHDAAAVAITYKVPEGAPSPSVLHFNGAFSRWAPLACGHCQ